MKSVKFEALDFVILSHVLHYITNNQRLPKHFLACLSNCCFFISIYFNRNQIWCMYSESGAWKHVATAQLKLLLAAEIILHKTLGEI
jgi:hypothetical protein